MSNPLLRTFDEFVRVRIIPDLRKAGSSGKRLTSYKPLSALHSPAYKKSCDRLHSTHVENLIDYNVGGGKNLRAKLLLDTYHELSTHTHNNETIQATDDFAVACAWSIEFIQASFLVADDIMDKSLTRRGKPCWYKVAGLTALNDALILESLAHRLIDMYNTGNGHPNVGIIKQLTEDVTYNVKFGQSLDMDTEKVGSLNDYTMERYTTIVAFKTAFYTTYLPVVMGMMLGLHPEQLNQSSDAITKICMKLGEFFQIQDDYLDCFGETTVTGKIGTDIQDNKCSWLVVQALQKANEQQKELLYSNYGKRDQARIQTVKQLYNELDLKNVYAEYQDSTCTTLFSEIDSLSDHCPKNSLRNILQLLQNRSK